MTRAVAAGVVAVIVMALIVVLALRPSSTPAAQQARLDRIAPGALFPRCPAGARALSAEAVARAADQARIEAPRLYPGDGPAVVTRSDLAPYAGPRGSEVKAQCGARTFHRTVVVQLLFPKELPSASLSQGVVFVSRFPTGYKVWEVAH